MTSEYDVIYREAAASDIPGLVRSRAADAAWGPADPRTGAYLAGRHHPRQALPPRVIFLALDGETVAGYIGGHLTERYGCTGELQYLWVSPAYRRRGIATRLTAMLMKWFEERAALRVCVDVLPENAVARSFYTRCGAVRLNAHWLVWEDISASRT